MTIAPLPPATLYYFHDPMCSWCWGFRPVSEQLFQQLPEGLGLQKVVGGLAPDTDLPMPPQLRQKLQAAWHRIHSMLGTEFNFDFWKNCSPRRSTYPACRAVLAADNQDRYDEMVYAIQQAYYLRAMNPSDSQTLQKLAAELGLDAAAFASDLRSDAVEARLQREIDFYRSGSSDGFPSLALAANGRLSDVAISYRDHRPMLAEIESLMRSPESGRAGSHQEPSR
jgi:putative protein-disulfide isomerase